MIDYIGKKSNYTITTTRDEDGYWTAVCTLIHSRSTDLINWEDKKVAVKYIDKNLNAAIQRAEFTITTYLENVGYDLFKGEDNVKTGSEQNSVS